MRIKEILLMIFLTSTIIAQTAIGKENINLIGSNTLNPEIVELSQPTSTTQQKSVSGKVSDSLGAAVPGVSVVIKGTTIGTITNINGIYTLSNIPANATLQFSFVGMKIQEVVVGKKTNIDVILEEETIGIEEVVAVGYGTMKRSTLTGASASVKSEKINAFPVANIADAIQGKAAGILISPAKMSGESSTIRIRGQRSLNANSDPLVIIDGMAGSLNDISSGDIEGIEILKDGASASVYGSRAANGVILVTTKAGKKAAKTKIELTSYFGIDKYEMI